MTQWEIVPGLPGRLKYSIEINEYVKNFENKRAFSVIFCEFLRYAFS